MMRVKSFSIEMISKFLIVGFCGFYLKQVSLNPLNISFILGVFCYCCCIVASRQTTIIFNKPIQWGLAYIGYLLLSQFIYGFTSSFFNILLSVMYFVITYWLLFKDKRTNIVLYVNWLLKISIVLLVFEAIIRFLNPEFGQIGFRQYKFNSIMYIDSNYVAMFIQSLFFMAFYFHEKKIAKMNGYLIVLFVLLVTTFSRASILTTIVFVFVFTKKIPIKWKVFVFIFGGIVALAVLANMISDASNQMRFYIIDQAFDFYFNEATLYEKLFGVGFGRTQEHIGFGAHLFIVTYLIESGIIGLIFISIFFIKLLKHSRFACKYVIYPFLVSGLALAPHLITYLYCEIAIIMVLETKCANEFYKSNSLQV